MKSFRYFLIIIILFTTPVLPQKKDLSLRQVTVQQAGLYPASLRQLKWIPGSNEFAYIDNKTSALLKGNVKNDKTESLVSLSELNGKVKDAGADSLSSFPGVEWISANTIRFWDNKELITYNLETKVLSVVNSVPDDAENIDAAQNNYAAYTIKNNLFISIGGKSIQVTKDFEKWIVNGQSVHRDEFGIFKGTFWSPAGNYLSFYRMDETMVTDYPVIDWMVRPAKVDIIKYPMAGMTSHEVTVGVYNIRDVCT